MLSSLRTVPIFAIGSILIFSGCATIIQPPPTITPSFTPAPLPTNTPVPTNTDLPPCDVDQTIKKLESKISYSESVILYNKMHSTSLLTVWFVDPEINPTPQESEITENVNLAIHDALLQSQKLNAEDGCVSRLFDEIYTVVVDKNYNGWFSGQIRTAKLPDTVPTDEEQLDKIAKTYRTSYVRKEVPAILDSAPSNSCTWSDAKQSIHNHFSPERENVDFYFVIEESSVDIWTQWDSQPDLLQSNLPTSLLNIATEVGCLFPEPYMIAFQVVDKTGETLVVGYWLWSDAKNQDLSQLHFMYMYHK